MDKQQKKIESNKKAKMERGITLIVLVVTIIVLLILAGISIAMLTGQNGVLNKAKEAKQKTEQAQKEEENNLRDLEILAQYGTTEYSTRDNANKPKLTAGMIPIKYNGTEKSWVITNEQDEEWYSYSNGKKWANVMLSDGKYKTSLKNYTTDGTTKIAINELGSMFVWIPRYAYKITPHKDEAGNESGGYHTNITGDIEIKFLIGTTNNTVDKAPIVEYNETTTANYTKFPENGYVVHPAFKDGKDNGYRFEAITDKDEMITQKVNN